MMGASGEIAWGLGPGAYRIAVGRSRLEVLVAREGMLSPVGHDLFVDATRFSGRVRVGADAGRVEIEVTVEAASVVARCARRQEEELRGALSASDLGDITRRLQKDVLAAGRHPNIVFRAAEVARGRSPRELHLPGTLAIGGRSGRVVVEAEQPEPDRPRFLVQCRFDQTALGLTPYTAFLGTLRVKNELRVRGLVELEPEPD